MQMTTRYITKAAVIAVLYVALTILLAPISYGIIQFRISEALMVLAAFTPAAIPGLFIGCVISNLVGGFGIIDILFGSLATLAAAFFTCKLSKHMHADEGVGRLSAAKPFLLPLPTVFFNGIIVGGYLPFIITDSGIESGNLVFIIAVSVFSVMLGELVVMFALGVPLYYAIKRTNLFSEEIIGDRSGKGME